jgi:RNA polymerase sigma-70 factor (ECF subfamily)
MQTGHAADHPDSARDPSRIHREFGQKVSRLCRRMIRNEETARDAAQEVWCEILGSLAGFDGRSGLSTWIWTIARRTIARHARKEKIWSTRFLAEFFDSRDADGLDAMERIPSQDRQAWIRLECDDCLTGIMLCVPHEERFVYLLRVLGGLPYAEIALVLEREEAAVRQSFSRSARKLRRFLDSQCLLYNPEGSCRCKMRQPILATDHQAEYRKVRELSRKMLFLEAAESYHPDKDYWKGLLDSAG